MNYNEMNEKELKILIEKIKQETRQKYKTKIAEETQKLKIECKEEIRTQKIQRDRYKISSPHVFKDMARELFGKEYKELTKEEKNKIFALRQKQRRKAVKEAKLNGTSLS